jgi:phospholipase/lecithinase/hemolysin
MIFLDFFAATEEIFENPKKYGIEAPINEFCPYDYLGQGTSPIADCAENQQKAGCKPVQQYAFVNEAHFTTVVHREITKYIIQTIDKFSEEQVTKDPMIVPMNGCQRGKQKESADKHCSGANKSSDSNTGVSLVSASANGKISFTSTFTTDQTPIVTIKSKTKTDTGSRTTVQHDWGKQFKNMVGGIVCELTPKICAKK